jgi:glycosyltransferase 2 family protein
MSKLLLRLAISAALLAWIACTVNWANVASAFGRLRPQYWLAAVALLLLSQVASARRWQLFARELKFQRTVFQLFHYYLIGMCFNLLLPTSVGGDVVRAWYLDGGSRRRLAALAAVFLDRFNGLVVLITLACGAVLLSPLELPVWVPYSVWGIAACAVLGIAALPVIASSRFLPPLRRAQLETMLGALHAPRALVEATAISMFVQAANVVVVWLLGMGLAAQVPASYYWVFVPMVSLLTLLPVSLNGMGVREGGMILFLTPLGVDQATALTLSFLWFAVNGAVSLLGGVVYLGGALPRPGAAPLPNEVEDEDGSFGGGADQGREGQLGKAA